MTCSDQSPRTLSDNMDGNYGRNLLISYLSQNRRSQNRYSIRCQPLVTCATVQFGCTLLWYAFSRFYILLVQSNARHGWKASEPLPPTAFEISSHSLPVRFRPEVLIFSKQHEENCGVKNRGKITSFKLFSSKLSFPFLAAAGDFRVIIGRNARTRSDSEFRSSGWVTARTKS